MLPRLIVDAIHAVTGVEVPVGEVDIDVLERTLPNKRHVTIFVETWTQACAGHEMAIARRIRQGLEPAFDNINYGVKFVVGEGGWSDSDEPDEPQVQGD
jgi:hypothetical protein